MRKASYLTAGNCEEEFLTFTHLFMVNVTSRHMTSVLVTLFLGLTGTAG